MENNTKVIELSDEQLATVSGGFFNFNINPTVILFSPNSNNGSQNQNSAVIGVDNFNFNRKK